LFWSRAILDLADCSRQLLSRR